MSKRSLYMLLGLLAVLVIALPTGSYVYNQSRKATTTSTPTPTPIAQSSHVVKTNSATYQGEDGKTALELLQAKYPETIVSGEGANAFVTSINGYKADDAKHEFWKLIVNGQDAQVGAGSLVTKSSDTIEWQIDTY